MSGDTRPSENAASAPGRTDLHGRIMNLPCVGEYRRDRFYQFGHRDARHAAAELALDADAALARLARERDDARGEAGRLRDALKGEGYAPHMTTEAHLCGGKVVRPYPSVLCSSLQCNAREEDNYTIPDLVRLLNDARSAAPSPPHAGGAGGGATEKILALCPRLADNKGSFDYRDGFWDGHQQAREEAAAIVRSAPAVPAATPGEWVPVTSGHLPPRLVRCLIVNSFGSIDVAERSGDGWGNDNWHRDIELHDAKFWRPLPPLPADPPAAGDADGAGAGEAEQQDNPGHPTPCVEPTSGATGEL